MSKPQLIYYIMVIAICLLPFILRFTVNGKSSVKSQLLKYIVMAMSLYCMGYSIMTIIVKNNLL